MSDGQSSFSRAILRVIAVFSLIGPCVQASAQTLSGSFAGAHVRLARIALCLGLVSFMLGAAYLRRRVGLDALKRAAIVGITFSLSCLVTSCFDDSKNIYSISVTATGLAPGTFVTVSDGSNSVIVQSTTIGSIVFYKDLVNGALYNLSLTSPAGQSCAFPNMTTTASGSIYYASVTLAITCVAGTRYTVTGTETGLASGTSLGIADSSTKASVTVVGAASGAAVGFTLDSGLTSGTAYSVTLTSPAGQSCAITSGAASGTITANVVLPITCSATAVYPVSVAVTGLVVGNSFTVSDTVSHGSVLVNGNGTFTVDAGLLSGASYTLSFTTPAGQTCVFTTNSLTSTSGTVAGANVTLNISCGAASFTPIALNGPRGMAFDAAGNLYVANGNGNQVLIYSEAGGGAGSPTLTETGSITNGINGPARLAFDASGYLYVANLGNNTVTVYQPGSPNTIVTTISNGVAHPLGVAVDQAGNVYVANNSANNLTMYTGSPTSGFTLSATYTFDYLRNQFMAPSALMFNAFGGLNDLFLGLGPSGVTNTVYEYTAPFTTLTYPNGSESNSSCSTGPSVPTGIATKGYGGTAASTLIYVTNSYTSNVTAYSLATFTNAGGCPAPVAVSGSLSQISQPEGVAVDAYGNVFVANAGNNTITVYTSITAAPIYTKN